MTNETAQPIEKTETQPRRKVQVGALCLNERGRILLITSRGTGRWVIPKGGVMPGKSQAESAMCEAWEEAGVEGRIGTAPIGSYRYDKQLRNGRSRPITVQVFLVTVDRLADDWLEAAQRTRRWFDPTEAAPLVDEPELRQLLRALPAPVAS